VFDIMSSMRRLIIIGSPGAGKTYLSREIADLTGLPLVHLDKLYHVKEHDYLNDKEAWVRKVNELVKEPSWIIEGNYGSTIYDRMKAADMIIFLDYPTYISAGRVLKRRFQYRNKVRDEMPSTWKEKIEPQFMKFVLTFKRKQRPRIQKYLKGLSGKEIVILTSPNKAKEYVNSLKQNRK
jgi:adenylate kinase family enzyme